MAGSISGIGKSAARLLMALGLGVIAAGTASAQQAPFAPSPDCLIDEDYVAPRFAHFAPGMLWRKDQFTLEGAILSWYLGGPKAILEGEDFNLILWANCFDPKVNVSCPGVRKDKKISRAFRRPFGKMTKGDEKAIEAYFSQPVPDAAIRFASEGIGRCFADHPAQATLEELGFTRGPFDPDTCARAAKSAPPTHGRPTFSGWRLAVQEHTAGRSCAFASAIALANADAKADEKALKQAQWENRPVEERIAGLNGCQIAYGLVTMGLGGQRGGVSRVPDDAISWALKYEQSVINNDMCPIMPKTLSDWVQAQPLTEFEAAEDPFEGFKRRRLSTGGEKEWAHYVRTLAAHYETSDSPLVDLSGDLCPDFHEWLAQRHYAGDGGSDELSKFLQSSAASLHTSVRPALCVAVPERMYQRYTIQRGVQAAQRAAFDEKVARRRAAMKALEDLGNAGYKSTYRPPAGEPRCYRTGEKTETCFFN